MGLDSAELIVEIEETFAIKIADRDAERIYTVGDAYRYILERFEAEDPLFCPGASAFYRFRRALQESQAVARDHVRLSTPLAELIPARDRKSRWQRLQGRLDLTLPRLEPPRWVIASTIGSVAKACLLLGVILVAGSWPGFPIRSALSSLLGASAAVAVVLSLWGLLATRFPRGCRTVRDLVLAIARTNYGRTRARGTLWDPESVWVALCDLIAQQLGVEPGEIREEHSFVYDYGY